MKIPKYLAAGAALTIALAATGVSASAQTTTTTTCIPDTTIVPEAQDAMALYVPFGPPAGVYVNGNWVPAAYLAGAASGNYIVGAPGCTNPVAPPTSVPISTTTTTS